MASEAKERTGEAEKKAEKERVREKRGDGTAEQERQKGRKRQANGEQNRRAGKWKRRLLAAALALLLLLTAGYFLICDILVEVALVPETMEKTEAFSEITQESVEALVQTDDIQQNRSRSVEKTNEWLEQVREEGRAETWNVTTEDGYRLVGTAVFQPAESHKWVLLLHGYTGWKEEMYPIACEYAERGYQVLCPDMRCSGESEGDFIGMGWTDRKDNLLWLERILERDPQAEIVIHGQSMGGACALMMTGEELGPHVKAVISDCGYTGVYEIFDKQIREWFHLPGWLFLNGADLVLRLKGGYDFKEASALAAVRESTLPILVIHGTEDVFVPPEMAEQLYEAAGGPKELLLVEGAGHAQSQDKDPQRYYGTVFSFLEPYVKGNGE